MKKRKGMTLIEVIISIMILGMISISILPIAGHAMKFAKWNNIKLNALNLAYSQVEWLKTLNYDDLGLEVEKYSPYGIVNPNGYINDSNIVNIDGVEYSIQTGIYWEKAISSMGEPVAQAMKKVDVTIEAKDVSTGAMEEYAVLGTLITRESERSPTEPGHVITRVYLRGGNEPAKNVRVGLGGSKPYSDYTNTDDKGEALFGNLTQGAYYIEPTHWKYSSLMIMPNGVNGTEWKINKQVTVPKWDKNNKDTIKFPEESFIIDFPGQIKIVENSNYPKDARFTIKPTGESYIPAEGESEDHMKLVTTVGNIKNTDFWRLWNYEYDISQGSEKFYLEDEKTNKIWDGKFDMTNLNKDSIAEVDLKFGLEAGTLVRNPDDPEAPVKISLVFSSNISGFGNMEFVINNDVIPVDGELVKIEKTINKNNQLTIMIDQTIGVDGGDLEFAIINYNSITNSYGMALAGEKSSITISQ